MVAAFSIGGTSIPPGSRQRVELPIASLFTHADPLTIPVHVVHGRRTGPTLFVSAAVHGDELNGVEIIRRLLNRRELQRVRGTLLAIPIVNAFGAIQHSRYLPDRRDLNRSFPGSERGSLAARLAHLFLTEIVCLCQYGIDLHTGSSHRTNLPQIRADLDDDATRAMADSFGVPVLINASLRDGSLREAANDAGVKTLLYEAGEALRLNEVSVRAGVTGIIRVMRHLGMLPAVRTRRALAEPFVARSTTWIRAPSSGLFTERTHLGNHVKVKERLATISDPSDYFSIADEDVVSTVNGVVIGKTSLPLVNEGDALYHIARFEDAKEVAIEVASFHQDIVDPERQF